MSVFLFFLICRGGINVRNCIIEDVVTSFTCGALTPQNPSLVSWTCCANSWTTLVSYRSRELYLYVWQGFKQLQRGVIHPVRNNDFFAGLSFFGMPTETCVCWQITSATAVEDETELDYCLTGSSETFLNEVPHRGKSSQGDKVYSLVVHIDNNSISSRLPQLLQKLFANIRVLR